VYVFEAYHKKAEEAKGGEEGAVTNGTEPATNST